MLVDATTGTPCGISVAPNFFFSCLLCPLPMGLLMGFDPDLSRKRPPLLGSAGLRGDISRDISRRPHCLLFNARVCIVASVLLPCQRVLHHTLLHRAGGCGCQLCKTTRLQLVSSRCQWTRHKLVDNKKREITWDEKKKATRQAHANNWSFIYLQLVFYFICKK